MMQQALAMLFAAQTPVVYDYPFNLLLNSLDQETLFWYVAHPNHITGDDVVYWKNFKPNTSE